MASALPERLRRAVKEVAPGLLTAAVDDIASGDDGEKTAEWICSALEAAWPEALAELAAEQPEAPAAGKLPAGWEAVERAVWGATLTGVAPGAGDVLSDVGELLVRVIAAIKPLWPAPPPPAAGEAIVSAIERALRVEPYRGEAFTICELVGDDVVGEIEDRVASALRSVELASAARAARLEAALTALIERAEAGGTTVDLFAECDRVSAVLAAPAPPSPLAALEALLADLDTAAERGDAEWVGYRIAYRGSMAEDVARRIRAAFGLPPKEEEHG